MALVSLPALAGVFGPVAGGLVLDASGSRFDGVAPLPSVERRGCDLGARPFSSIR